MKKNRKTALSMRRSLGNDFIRGALVSGVVAAVAQHERPRLTRGAARAALQGGTVLAAATVAADALEARRYLTATLAVLGAVAGIQILKQVLPGEESAEDAAALRSVS
jgi:hypothetical protein